MGFVLEQDVGGGLGCLEVVGVVLEQVEISGGDVCGCVDCVLDMIETLRIAKYPNIYILRIGQISNIANTALKPIHNILALFKQILKRNKLHISTSQHNNLPINNTTSNINNSSITKIILFILT